jgi:hypothetical protein
MRIQADPDPDQTFESQKVEFLHENILEVDTYEGTKAFLKCRKPGLLINFAQFPCSWIRIRVPDTDTDPRQINECGSRWMDGNLARQLI